MATGRVADKRLQVLANREPSQPSKLAGANLGKRSAQVIGVTGVGSAGKRMPINYMIALLHQENRSVVVLAIGLTHNGTGEHSWVIVFVYVTIT
jgi:putative protein kinase ArgK-like GTPase of G3E family